MFRGKGDEDLFHGGAGLPEGTRLAAPGGVALGPRPRHQLRGRRAPGPPSAAALERFCRALLSDDDPLARAMLAEAAEGGASEEALCLDWLAPAARLLGAWWLTDQASFVAVTHGTGRIRALMHARAGAPPAPRRASAAVSVIFAPVPGEQHSLGVSMAAELFRRDGWDVALRVGASRAALLEAGAAPACLLGLSLGGAHSLDALAELLGALRRQAPRCAVLVSGQSIAALKPALAKIGPDAVVRDMAGARLALAGLWDRAQPTRGR